jgi:cystathionine beta-lyase/cystathionine gamma-synthase
MSSGGEIRSNPNGIREPGMRTVAIHAGEGPDPVTHASAPNLVMSTTFTVEGDAGFSAEAMGDEPRFVYTRWGNPTVDQLERKLAALEGAESAVAFGSGMAALYALLFHTLKSGDHAVISDVAYAALSESANETLPDLGITVTRVDTSNTENIGRALTPRTRLVHVETPCNPLLRLTDLAAAAEVAHAGGALLSVDSTFATPAALKPIELGADFVVPSLTKYLGGHGDAVGGAIIGSDELLRSIRRKTALRMGGILSPFNAWLIMRGLATFPLRMRAHEESALKIAAWLEQHPRVSRVIYPGLPSHPQHDLACRQMRNFAGMISFQVPEGRAAARVLSERLGVIHYAVSLGHHRSLIFYIGTDDLMQTTFNLDGDQLASWRTYAGDGVFRFSVGLEDPEDLIADLDQALEAV